VCSYVWALGHGSTPHSITQGQSGMPGVALAGARWEVEGTMWPAVCCAGRGESEVGHGCRCDNVCTCGDTLSSKRRASAFGAHLLLTIYAPVLRPSVWCPWGARVWCALSGTANWDLTHDGASAHREVNPTILVLCLCRDCVVLVLCCYLLFYGYVKDKFLPLSDARSAACQER
jgi:hypothetical protein